MAADAPGTIIAGKYELTERVGEGGMASVWRAVTRGAAGFQRPVAIKRVLGNLAQDPHFLAMFIEEARVGAALQHPNIVQTLDFGDDEDGNYFLVMEWVDGMDLGRYLFAHRGSEADGGVAHWSYVVAIAIEVLKGLSAAHERTGDADAPAPVFHRDVTPSNILVGLNGITKLADFGLAKAMDRASMTRPNVLKGKLSYSAPELMSGGKPSAQSDLWSLGVVLWEALVGRKLFTGKNEIEVIMKVRQTRVLPIETLRPDLPSPLSLAVAQALATSPEERPASAREMGRMLAAILRTVPEAVDSEVIAASVRAARDRISPPPRR